MAVMNKTLIIHHINDIDNIPAMERWFVHHHCPEVMAQEPWLTRYVMYRVMPPAKGMETMGFFNYRVHENLGLDVEGRRSLRAPADCFLFLGNKNKSPICFRTFIC